MLFQPSYPYSLVGGKNEFVPYNQVAIVDQAIGYPQVIVDIHSETQAPNTLKLTRTQAQDRLMSRLVGSNMDFPNGAARRIDDVLIDKKTGDVSAWVVDMGGDTPFNMQRRALPPSSVSISAGKISTSTQIAVAGSTIERPRRAPIDH